MQALPPATPGVYPGSSQASLLRTNEQQYLVQGQKIVTGQASIAVQLERIKFQSYPFGCSFQYWFTSDAAGLVPATPGAFEIDVQTADLDQEPMFVSVNQINAGLNASFAGRVELPSLYAKYVRVKMVALANSVFVWVLVTR